jgi:hypothetical protein
LLVVPGFGSEVDWNLNNLVAKGAHHDFVFQLVDCNRPDLQTISIFNFLVLKGAQVHSKLNVVLLVHNNDFIVASAGQDVSVSHCNRIDEP